MSFWRRYLYKNFFLLHPIVCLCLKSLKKQKFWQGIPRFPRRWRTQRSAIVIAICKCTWIIKFSNAVCICGLLLQICLIDRSTPRQPFVCCLRLCEWWFFHLLSNTGWPFFVQGACLSALDFCMLTVWLCMELAIAKLLRNSRICVDCALAIIAFACVKPAEEIPGPSHFLVCKIYFCFGKHFHRVGWQHLCSSTKCDFVHSCQSR